MNKTFFGSLKKLTAMILLLVAAGVLYTVLDHFISLRGTLRNRSTFLIQLLPNYYIGLRGWQFIGKHVKYLNAVVYWLLFWAIAQSYILGKVADRLVPDTVGDTLLVLDWYWYVAIIYFMAIIVIIDIIRLLNRRFHFLPEAVKRDSKGSLVIGLSVFSAVVLILIYGTWNAQNPKIKHYDLSITKEAGDLEKLDIALISDTHLGKIVNVKRLEKMVEMINGLNSDIVLFAGDTIDDDYRAYLEKGMPDILGRIKSRYGMYAVLGNHEYYNGNMSKNISNLREAGITVLFDSYVKVGDSFYVAGRDDKGYGRKTRKKLSEFIGGIDHSLPVILLDHWPADFDEAAEQGVDLQLSGHTHNGQYFPGQIGNKLMHELDYGYLQKDGFQAIVTAGFGTWGVPARIGSDSEITYITLTFEK